jgi:hypothetical protein
MKNGSISVLNSETIQETLRLIKIEGELMSLKTPT